MPWLKPGVFLLCSLPFLVLAKAVYEQDLGANPIQTLNHASGIWTLRLLLVTLSMTPLRQLSGWSGWIRLRRMLGLFTFFYAALHFLSWAWLDQQFHWSSILEDVLERPYITVGFAAFVLLIPLALTSNREADCDLALVVTELIRQALLQETGRKYPEVGACERLAHILHRSFKIIGRLHGPGR